ncbi:hypothetical protein [Hyphococcus sp.]|uniref:hypothetical protein n=1 Tax=Hyphococcus sp. TaxID=2038636 RepID=UPI0035C74A89
MVVGGSMHITNVSSYAGVAALQGKQSAENLNGADFLAEVEGERDPIAAVMANYDLQNITPVEIDQLVDELRGAGHPFDQNLLMLSARGAEFRSHLAEVVGGVYDPHQQIDLVAQTQDQLIMARRYGDPTEAIERFLDYLKSYDEGDVHDAGRTQQRLVHETMLRDFLGATHA